MPKKSAHKIKPEKKNSSLKNRIVYLCSCCAVIVLLFLSTQNLKSADDNRRVLGAQVAKEVPTPSNVAEEVAFWQVFLAQTPTYFNGWLELATLQLQMDDIEAAKLSLAKAREIDPNSESLKIIEASPLFD